MRRRNNFALALVGTLLAVSAGSALALDTREVVVEKSEGLVEVPRHVGHVLANPNRNFSFDIAPEDADWRVLKGFSRHGVFNDRSVYMEHADNLFHQVTYFDFDEAEPVNSELVATRVRHQLGYLPDDGLTFLVVGHADEAGTQSYNKALSLRRANEVVALLVADGHDASRFKVEGRGKLDPASFTDQALNRRVDVIVRGDKDARLAYTKMKQGGGALTCRGCIPNPSAAPRVADVAAPIGREALRQPSLPLSAPAIQPAKEPTATMKAMQRLTETSKALESGGNGGGDFRADENPLGMKAPPAAPSLQDILSPLPDASFQTNPNVGDR